MGSKLGFVASLALDSTELNPSCGSFGADHAGQAPFPKAASQDRGKVMDGMKVVDELRVPFFGVGCFESRQNFGFWNPTVRRDLRKNAHPASDRFLGGQLL